MPWRGPDGAVELGTDCFSVSALGAAGVARIERRGISPAKKEKDQLALAQYGDKLCARPDPNDPGGLGAEESGIERTEPTQYFLLAIQQGVRWAEVGRYYDSG
jgi:hypothetical protein